MSEETSHISDAEVVDLLMKEGLTQADSNVARIALKHYLKWDCIILTEDEVECAAEYAGIEPDRLMAAMKFYNERAAYLAKQANSTESKKS